MYTRSLEMTIRAARRSLVREHDHYVGTTHTIGLSGNSAIFPALLGLAIGFAALIRIAHLGTKSIWSDEAFSIVVAKLPWADFGHVVTTGEANMSFYYFLLRPWVRFGDDASYIRLLSVLAGVAVIPVVYLIGRDVLSRRAGIFAALLLSVNVFHIRYSQEARSYSLVVLLVAVSFLSFFRCIKEQNHFWSACHVLSSVLALYAHFFAALALFAQIVSLAFLPRHEHLVRKQVQRFCIIAALGAPLVWFILFRNDGQLDWVHRPSAKDLYHLFLYMTGSGLKFGIALGAFVIALKVWVSRWSGRWTVQTWSFLVLMLWLFIPIGIGFFLSFWKPVFLARFLIVCLPAALLLAACGLAEINQQWIGYALVVVMLLGALAPISSYYAEPGPQDWKSAVGYVAENAGGGDVALLPSGYCEMPLRYYIIHAAKIPSFPKIFSAPNGVQRARHIWMISCTAAGEPGGSQVIPGYRIEEIKQFKGIQVVELNDFPAGQLP
jgi:4-amino-4-deoxy-L-arabinose transferase-like glycosyltransferase